MSWNSESVICHLRNCQKLDFRFCWLFEMIWCLTRKDGTRCYGHSCWIASIWLHCQPILGKRFKRTHSILSTNWRQMSIKFPWLSRLIFSGCKITYHLKQQCKLLICRSFHQFNGKSSIFECINWSQTNRVLKTKKCLKDFINWSHYSSEHSCQTDQQ